MSAAPRGPWPDGFDLQGHRGARGHVAESTWEGFVHGVRLGATTLEFDVRLTADGRPVVWHDAVLDRAIGPGDDAGMRGRRVRDLTAAQVTSVQIGGVADPERPQQRLTPGERLLTLADLLSRMRSELPGVWANIEVKIDADDPWTHRHRDELVDAVLADVEASAMSERAIIHSFDWSVLRGALHAAPHLPRSALVSPENLYAGPSALGGVDVADGETPWTRDRVLAAAVAVGAQAICPRVPWSPPGPDEEYPGLVAGESLEVDAAFVDAAHAAGLAVVPWTVDDPAQIERLLRAGVDGLVSDFPDRVIQVRRKAADLT